LIEYTRGIMSAQPAGAVIPLLHRFLGIGLLILASVFAVLRGTGSGPVLPPDDPAGATIVYVFAGLALALIAVARLFLKPRVPPRRMGLSVDDYWTQPGVVQRVFAVWFTLEGAAILTLVGYYMVGGSIAAVATSLAIIAFWLNGPRTFDSVQV
jgi:hypothetical protein